MELDKLISNLEHLNDKGVRSIKLVFCDNSIEIKELLNEIKLCYPGKR